MGGAHPARKTPVGARPPLKRRRLGRLLLAAVLLPVLALTACQTPPPKDAFLLPGSTVEEREMQSRLYETKDEVKLIAAGIGVLQDMGYSIDETEKSLGLVTASKTVDARSNAQMAGAVAVILLGGNPPPIDRAQTIRVSLVTTPSQLKKGEFIARVTFQRIIINSEGNVSRVETINDKKIYQEFFEKLSKSVFLEGHHL
ncbi:MAG TPA: hypothetical protein VKC56_05510 [Gallionellaceae bacterium]|nr:hypothetical protein [Gallionellaceae bacterium]